MKFYWLVIFCFIGSFSFAQLNYLNSTDGGSTYEVCYYNNHLFSGNANTLEIYDLTGVNQTPGTLKFKKRFLSNIDQILVRNGFLYICANHDGLWKFDVNQDPANPVFVSHYVPKSIDESVYDVGFYGDSIVIAAKSKVTLLLDSAGSISFLKDIAGYSGTTRVRGLDIKDSLLAYTVGFSASNAIDGVYFLNIKTLIQMGFYNNATADPLEVYFGQSNNTLHVMGGTLSSFPFVNGIYYALDYTNPESPVLIYNDTIKGTLLLGSISSPMSARIINDTLYIATHGGGPVNYTGGPFTGQVYVYDATEPDSIHLLTGIYAGLYHFDVDINEATRKMYIASEWYGILTVDVKNIFNEIFHKKNPTGGWCHGSAVAKNKMAEASEGYGIRLYDVTILQSPKLIAEDTTVGFCRAISISDSADYVYSWFLTGKRLRVHGANSLSYVSDTSVDPGTFIISDFKKSRFKNGNLAVIEEISANNKKIVVADVSNPVNPIVKFYRKKNNVEDILFHPSGQLFACSHDSILVFDPSDMSLITSISPPLSGLQQFKAFTLSMDTLYVYYSGIGEGVARYYYNESNKSITYLSASTYNMNSNARIFMASSDSLLFIASSLDSLKAITKTSPWKVIANYNHGADFIYDNLWGITDLYFSEEHLFLNEYMGQTSIFGSPSIITGNRKTEKDKDELIIFPNPCRESCTIYYDYGQGSLLRIFNVLGELIYSDQMDSKKNTINTSDLDCGIYFVTITSKTGVIKGKVIVEN